MKKHIQNKKEKGFTLAETVIAIFLITVGIFAAVSLLVSSFRDSSDVEDHEIAILLAQEGVELVRNLRDNNWAAKTGSFSLHFPSIDFSNCRIDKDSATMEEADCNNGSNANKRELKLSGGYYVHSGSTDTKFKRKVGIEYSDNKDYAKITGMAVWERGNFPNVDECRASNQCAYTEVYLYSWGE